MQLFQRTGRFLAIIVLLAVSVPLAEAGDDWIDLSGTGDLSVWQAPTGEWQLVGSVRLDPKNPKRLVAGTEPGNDVLWNGPTGKTNNLVTKERFGDVQLQLELMVSKRSNSGVKFEGLYEVQIYDSWGAKRVTASDCGGIYPRAELEPRYHHIDKGYPPRTNAARPPGQWQTLDIVFLAPRFDAQGKKVANARLVKVVLNGQMVQENLELSTPTGHAWVQREVPTGPLLLQADHGPVAFRNVRIRRLDRSEVGK